MPDDQSTERDVLQRFLDQAGRKPKQMDPDVAAFHQSLVEYVLTDPVARARYDAFCRAAGVEPTTEGEASSPEAAIGAVSAPILRDHTGRLPFHGVFGAFRDLRRITAPVRGRRGAQALADTRSLSDPELAALGYAPEYDVTLETSAHGGVRLVFNFALATAGRVSPLHIVVYHGAAAVGETTMRRRNVGRAEVELPPAVRLGQSWRELSFSFRPAPPEPRPAE